MSIATNFVIFVFCSFYFSILSKQPNKYAKQMAWFMFLMGISSCFGSIGHGVHYQLGETFFKTVLFISHAFNLTAIYFCFKAAYTFSIGDNKSNRAISSTSLVFLVILLFLALFTRNFLVIKIPAGLVLIYSLIVHYVSYRKGNNGSAFVVLGILISFFSIIVHSLKLSFNDWFNYKDIAHLIIVVSLIFITKGVKQNIGLTGTFFKQPN